MQKTDDLKVQKNQIQFIFGESDAAPMGVSFVARRTPAHKYCGTPAHKYCA
jgi:hypothetical protein